MSEFTSEPLFNCLLTEIAFCSSCSARLYSCFSRRVIAKFYNATA